jgi:hypothetical protein
VQEAQRQCGARHPFRQGADTAEEADGYVLTCCATPLSDVVLESRQVTDANAFPIKKMPVRVAALRRSRTT